MIALSLLLIVGAVTLLVVGVWQASNLLLGMSIGLSLLAAVGLIVAARRGVAGHVAPVSAREAPGAGGRPPAARPPSRPPVSPPPPPAGAPPPPARVKTSPPATPPAADPPPTGGVGGTAGAVTVPAAREPVAAATTEPVPEPEDEPSVGDRTEDPPDEPEVQPVSPGDAARVAQLTARVLVVDGRPRYHQPGCVSLLGRESEGLPVNEAVELGFTPCGLCEPDSALLADARRV